MDSSPQLVFLGKKRKIRIITSEKNALDILCFLVLFMHIMDVWHVCVVIKCTFACSAAMCLLVILNSGSRKYFFKNMEACTFFLGWRHARKTTPQRHDIMDTRDNFFYFTEAMLTSHKERVRGQLNARTYLQIDTSDDDDVLKVNILWDSFSKSGI